MGDQTLGTDAIKGVVAGRLVVRLGLFVDGEAVGEFGAVVGQDGMDLEREAGAEAVEKAGRGLGPAIGQDFEIDKAGGAIDGDIGVTAAPVERRQVFDVDVDEPGRRLGVKGGGRRFVLGVAGGEAVPLQAAVDGAARQPGIDAAPHRLGDVVERQRQLRRSSITKASSQSVKAGFKRCGRVDRSTTSRRPFHRATVRLWMPSSRASAAIEALLFWI